MIRDLARNLRVRSILSHGQRVDPVTGDSEKYIDTHQIHVTADEVVLQDTAGTPYRAESVDVTVDLNVPGIDGLDMGVRSPGTWYHMWIISDSGGSVKGLLSASASNPTLPAGFVNKGYVGAVYNSANDCLIQYYQNGNMAWAEKTCPLSMTPFPTSPKSVDLSVSVPSTALSAIFELSGLTKIGGHYISNISVGPTPDGPWHNRWMMVAGTPQDAGAIDHVQFSTQCEVLIDSPQKIYAYVGTQNDELEIHVLGWRYYSYPREKPASPNNLRITSP